MKTESAKRTEEFIFKIEPDRIRKVGIALDGGDISECMAHDVKHTCEVLAHVLILEDLRPGFIGEFMSVMIPHYIKIHNKQVIGEEAQRRADADGFGDEWRFAIEAGNHPKQKDYLALMVAVHMKANGVTQADAIRAIAKQSAGDEDSLRRTVTRSKNRAKKS